MSYDKNAFCGGKLCRLTDRKYKSCVSGKTGCKICMVELPKNKYCTIDELFTSEKISIIKALKDINKDSTPIKITNKNKAVN